MQPGELQNDCTRHVSGKNARAGNSDRARSIDRVDDRHSVQGAEIVGNRGQFIPVGGRRIRA